MFLNYLMGIDNESRILPISGRFEFDGENIGYSGRFMLDEEGYTYVDRGLFQFLDTVLSNRSLFSPSATSEDLCMVGINCEWMCKFVKADVTPGNLVWNGTWKVLAREVLNGRKTTQIGTLIVGWRT